MAFKKLDFSSRGTGSSTEPCLHVTPSSCFLNSAFVRASGGKKEKPFYIDLMYDEDKNRFAIEVVGEDDGGKICKPSKERSHVPIHLKGVFASVGIYVIKKEVAKVKEKKGMWIFELKDDTYTTDLNEYNEYKAKKKAIKEGKLDTTGKKKKKKKTKNR